jgi:predicted small lipoprotein YifL
MHRRRQAALALLAALVAAGCGQLSPREAPPAAAAEHVFVHVHEFPDIGVRIALPTGTPGLTWQQALQAVARRNDVWESRTPPQVKLADFSNCCNGEGPVRPTLAWIVVYPDAEVVEFGRPDFAPPPARVSRCPAYVAVDATSGRGWGAFQTCDPPYRG